MVKNKMLSNKMPILVILLSSGKCRKRYEAKAAKIDYMYNSEKTFSAEQ